MADKFQYTTEFQESILKYTVKNQDGYKALRLYEPEYFDLIEHQAIAHTIKLNFSQYKTIPSSPTTLKELCNDLYQRREWSKAITKEDKTRITKLISSLYRGNSQDGEVILEKCVRFAQYISLTHTIENHDLSDFSSYDRLHQGIQKSINIGTDLSDEVGTFLLKDISTRQLDRKLKDPVKPFPYSCLNRLTNAGGYYEGALITLVDKAKGFKTGFLANLAKEYLKMRKNVIIFDLENGEESISMRLEQSIGGITKRELLSGEYDDKIRKTFRKWRRLKDDRGNPIELIIKRLPALSNADEMQYWIDFYFKEYGIKFQNIIIDYVGLMGSISRKDDVFARISDAYIDVKNLAKANNIDHIWTAHHVKREADKFKSSCYEASHLAKCIDIHRHVDMLVGLNQNEIEAQAKVARIEIIDQRDGYPSGHGYFFLDQEIQRIKPLSIQQSKQFDEMNNSDNESSNSPPSKRRNLEDDR